MNVTATVPALEPPPLVEQEEGTTNPAAPQPGNAAFAPLLAWKAVRAAAYDQVKSVALTGLPVDLLNCSAKPPPEGVYLAFTTRKPSAKALIAVVSVVYSVLVDA